MSCFKVSDPTFGFAPQARGLIGLQPEVDVIDSVGLQSTRQVQARAKELGLGSNALSVTSWPGGVVVIILDVPAGGDRKRQVDGVIRSAEEPHDVEVLRDVSRLGPVEYPNPWNEADVPTLLAGFPVPGDTVPDIAAG